MSFFRTLHGTLQSEDQPVFLSEYGIGSALNLEQLTREFEQRDATFFVGDHGPTPIDTVVEWSRTIRGGRQFPLIREAPDTGCFRWGLCEPPTKEGQR